MTTSTTEPTGTELTGTEPTGTEPTEVTKDSASVDHAHQADPGFQADRSEFPAAAKPSRWANLRSKAFKLWHLILAGVVALAAGIGIGIAGVKLTDDSGPGNFTPPGQGSGQGFGPGGQSGQSGQSGPGGQMMQPPGTDSQGTAPNGTAPNGTAPDTTTPDTNSSSQEDSTTTSTT